MGLNRIGMVMTYYFWLGKDAEYERRWETFMRAISAGGDDLRAVWNAAADEFNKKDEEIWK